MRKLIWHCNNGFLSRLLVCRCVLALDDRDAERCTKACSLITATFAAAPRIPCTSAVTQGTRARERGVQLSDPWQMYTYQGLSEKEAQAGSVHFSSFSTSRKNNSQSDVFRTVRGHQHRRNQHRPQCPRRPCTIGQRSVSACREADGQKRRLKRAKEGSPRVCRMQSRPTMHRCQNVTTVVANIRAGVRQRRRLHLVGHEQRTAGA